MGLFRWASVPLGMMCLVAVGIHLAADGLDDALLPALQPVDAFFDSLFSDSATWVNAIESRQIALIARGLSLALELLGDFFFAIPLLGFELKTSAESLPRLRTLFLRVPTIFFPALTFVFVFAGALSLSRLVESTAYLGLSGDVTSPKVAAVVARFLSALCVALVLFSLGLKAIDSSWQRGWRLGQKGWRAGFLRCGLALPLAVVALLQAPALLARVWP
jgi:hypothetical protein